MHMEMGVENLSGQSQVVEEPDTRRFALNVCWQFKEQAEKELICLCFFHSHLQGTRNRYAMKYMCVVHRHKSTTDQIFSSAWLHMLWTMDVFLVVLMH